MSALILWACDAADVGKIWWATSM